MILLYHLIFPDDTPSDTWNAGKILRLSDFKRQINWLKKYYHIVQLDQYVNVLLTNPNSITRSTAITFDDGYRATFDLVSPFLESESVPATFFLSTSHLEHPRLLWFVYFNALCFEKVYDSLIIEGLEYPLDTEKNCLAAWRKLISLARSSGDAIKYSNKYEKDYPLPDQVINKYLGLREQQIKQIGRSKVLEVGGHTHNHPYLDQLSLEHQEKEMKTNKKILEELTGKPVDHFAYTGGIYNVDAIDAVKVSGFKAGFAVRPLKLGTELRYEIPRVDIYSGSLVKFISKQIGVSQVALKISRWRKPHG